MSIDSIKRASAFTIIALFLSGCKIQISTPEYGSVVSQSGNYSCEADSICTIDVVDLMFDETFTVAPNAGYDFDHWKVGTRQLCAGSAVPCQLTTANFTDNQELLSLLGSDEEVFFLEPVFRNSELRDFFERPGTNFLNWSLPNFIPPALGAGLAVDFPLNNSRYQGTSITVSGSVYPEMTTQGLTIRVDAGIGAIQATLTDTGKWIANDVPLPEQENSPELLVTVTNEAGSEEALSVELDNLPSLHAIFSAFDPDRPDILYLLGENGFRKQLVKVDLATGQRSIIYEESFFDREFGQVFDVEFDPLSGKLLVADLSYGRIMSIDVISGAVDELSGNLVGSGPIISGPWDMDIDIAGRRLLVIEYNSPTIYSVDITTGQRTVIADNSGAGPTINSPQHATVDFLNNRAYILDGSSVVIVDLITGDRSLMDGNFSFGVNSIVLDKDLGVIAGLQWLSGEIEVIDMSTGVRSSLSAAGSSGIHLGAPMGIRLDVLHNRYIVDDIFLSAGSDDSDAIVAVDRTTGARSFLVEDRVGTGPEIVNPGPLVVDRTTDTVYVADGPLNSIFRVDTQTGSRELLSSGSKGAGPLFDGPSDISLDRAHRRLLVANWGGADVIAVDIETGDRAAIASAATGNCPATTRSAAMAYLQLTNTVILLDHWQQRLLELNLDTLECTILSDIDHGNGINFISPMDLTLDIANRRILLIDQAYGGSITVALVAVDLDTGNRSVVSEVGAVGTGTWFNDPVGIALSNDSLTAFVGTLDGFIVAIELSTGNRRILAGPVTGGGVSLINLQSIETALDDSVIYGAGTTYDALLGVNANTGDRVIVSK